MAIAADIVWRPQRGGAWLGTLGAVRAIIRPHPTDWGFEVHVVTSPARSSAPACILTAGEAMAWVEQELLRLANEP